MKTAKRNNILPDDILFFHILWRLPASSLGRFMCVCKQWRSFLTTPVFIKMHLHHVNNQNHQKLLVFSTTEPYKYFRTIDCETLVVGLSANRLLPFEANYNEMRIISSLNGLVCVGIDYLQPRSHRYSDLILWNPLTGDNKTLSKDNNSHANCLTIEARGYGLYYSCFDDDYKLLRVTQSSDAYIYSLKSDSWRKVETTINCLLKFWNISYFLNENLYFLAQGSSQIRQWSYLIIRFDTKIEKFIEIAAPSFEYVVPPFSASFSFTAVRGCIHLCVTSSKGMRLLDTLELWKMDGDGEWTKVGSYCDRQHRRLFNEPLHLMKNGNWLLRSTDKGYVCIVDLEMKTAIRVCVCTTTSDGTMGILHRGKFVETIVSLKQ